VGDGPDDLACGRRIQFIGRSGAARWRGRRQLPRRAARRRLDVSRRFVDAADRDARCAGPGELAKSKSTNAIDRAESVGIGPAIRTTIVHGAKSRRGHAGRRRALRERDVGDRRLS
jgi:hypothetical protein